MPGRVIVMAYQFPPVGGVGVQRTLKYVTYLPRWGWETSVIAPRDPGYPLRDETLLAVVPQGQEVDRCLSLEPSRVQLKGSRLLRRIRVAPAFGHSSAVGGTPGAVRGGGRRLSPKRLARKVLRSGVDAWARFWGFVLFPDEGVAWVPFGVRLGRRVVKKNPVDVIYSSAPPWSTHYAGARLKKATGLPWVADFRDPWVGNPFAVPTSRRVEKHELKAERWLVEQDDRVVYALEEMGPLFIERYPDMAHKFRYIPNGYDRNDLAGIVPVAGEPGRYTIMFAGSLYRPGELEAFLGGVELVVARRPDLRPRFRVEFVGRANADNRRIAAEYTAPGRLGDVVRFEDFLPRPQVLARMAGADALLQLMTAAPGTSMFVGGKLLEYLAFDRPILAVMPPGDGRRLVDGLPCGYTADLEPASVAAALERMLDAGPTRQPLDPDGRYDRVNLARELAAILDEVREEAASRRR
jgi:glycosyltransferase involved in cell wall biosynthesis